MILQLWVIAYSSSVLNSNLNEYSRDDLTIMGHYIFFNCFGFEFEWSVD